MVIAEDHLIHVEFDVTKISMTASYYNVPIVRELLHTCDVIYTTNTDRLPQLREIFGDKVVVNYPVKLTEHELMDQYPNAEFIVFGDLRYIIRKSIEAGDKETIDSLIAYCGWSKSSVALYDGEGVDGHAWVKSGKEYTAVGDDVPQQVIDDMAGCFHSSKRFM